VCGQPIADTYYEISSRVACPRCRERLAAEWSAGTPASRLAAAAAFGAGAALVGALGWFAIMEITGLNLGIVALAVGWLVGRAVGRGSRGRGGLGYQVLAALLTYASIAGALASLVLAGEGDASGPGAGPVALAMVGLALPVIVGIDSPLSALIFGFALWQAWRMNRRASLAITGPFSRSPALASASGTSAAAVGAAQAPGGP
jgi:hypothetical protein